MRKICVVIGAAYGDEGKGLMTDYLTHQIMESGRHATVVRFNGGAQAGHTVTTPDGSRRHVFHHFGSGSFAGASTLLGPEFVCNPILFASERKELVHAGVYIGRVGVDPKCPITTPYDMLLNQFIEKQRGINKHGSCGVGFGETLEREQRDHTNSLVYDDMRRLQCDFEIDQRERHNYLRHHLERMIKQYYIVQIEERITNRELRADAMNIIGSELLMKQYLESCAYFLQHTMPMKFATFVEENPDEDFVFEGAQGLLLDQSNIASFPHVTRSATGLENVTSMLVDLDADFKMNVYYMTRAYTTRHGAGPLPHEVDALPYKIVDTTNVPNTFQDTLRYAPFSFPLYHKAVSHDSEFTKVLHRNERYFGFESFKVVTCVDQVCEEPAVSYYDSTAECKCTGAQYEEMLSIAFDYMCYGPTRTTVYRGQRPVPTELAFNLEEA